MSAADLELNDSRVEFMADYVIKTLKIKPDKFSKMYSVEDTRQMFLDFFEKSDVPSLVIAQPGGTLITTFEWPNKPKAKASRDSINKDTNLRTSLIWRFSYAPLDQLSAFLISITRGKVFYNRRYFLNFRRYLKN